MCTYRAQAFARRGFTLVELVMVVATMGFVAGIAAPRMSTAAENAQAAQIEASTRTLTFALELYAAEHFDRWPTENADGSVQTNPDVVIARLTMRTDENGNPTPSGMFGPYLKSWPTNPANGKNTVRIGGAAPGADTDGWQISPQSRTISPDKVKGKGKGIANVPAAPPDLPDLPDQAMTAGKNK
jgi:prepilin-type N-terminal cleavage/methylation domain-containing protein